MCMPLRAPEAWRVWYDPSSLEREIILVATVRRTIDRMFGSQRSTLVNEIKALAQHQPGWNSYRAPAISPNAIKIALDVVDAVAHRGAPLPSAAPSPDGGVMLSWDLPTLEVQLLVDEDSLDFSVARPGNPKIIDQQSVYKVHELEYALIERYLTVR